MDAFDQLPSRRPKQRTNSPLATPAAFTFNGPQDMPKGMTLKETPDGFKASAPSRTPLMAVFFSLILMGVGYMLSDGMKDEQVPTSFVVVMSIILLLALVMFGYFTLGRESIEIKGDKLYMRKTVFGLGFAKTLIWRKIMRAQVVKRTGFRGIGILGPVGMATLPVGKVGDQVLELETDTHIKKMGSHLRADHLYFMRYLIIEAVKSSRGRR